MPPMKRGPFMRLPMLTRSSERSHHVCWRQPRGCAGCRRRRQVSSTTSFRGYYGVGIENALTEAANIHCPLMLHLAAQDQFCPPAAQAQLHQALDGLPRVTLHDYAQQDHAFARPGGAHYDAVAAELANLRTLEFFVRSLGLGTGPSSQQLAALWEEHIRHEF